MASSKVSIIVLNWNGWKDTIECLESLYQITYSNYEVIVVDNGSMDESIQMMKEYCKGNMLIKSNFISFNRENKPIYIKEYTREEIETKNDISSAEGSNVPSNRKLIIIKNGKNYGFAEGNNIGIEFALNNGSEYIFILNNDTIVAKEFLDRLVDSMENDKEVGIAGPTCYFYDDPKMIWASGIKINWWIGLMKNVESGKIKEVDSVTGCAMLINNKVFDKISSLDTRFPFGNEDYEFCTRARKAGFKAIYVPDSKIYHKVSKSRNKLLRNIAERKALLGDATDFILVLRYRQLFFKVCSPSKAQYMSQNIFYFIVILPLSALLSCRKYGLKESLKRAKLLFQEILIPALR